MLKFFRKIRQKLINSNRFSKYLIYAIGEIVLVVIGILIALSINNWNEDKKALKKEITIYNEFISELNETEEELNNDLEALERNLTRSIVARNMFVKKENNQDSLKKYIRALYNQKYFGLKTSTFESLKSIGLDKLSNDSIRQALTNLYQLDFPYFLESSAQLEHLKFPDKFLPLLKEHLVLDNNIIRTNIEEGLRMERRHYFPYGFKNLEVLYNDDLLGVTIQESLNWRSARIRQLKWLIEKIQRVTQLTESELKRLQVK